MLKKSIVPYVQKKPNMVLQQDFATAHGAKSTIHFMQQRLPCFLDKSIWLSSSPDLNPLNFSVWGRGVMKDKLNLLKSRIINSLDALKCELIKSWNSLDPDYMWRTINFMVLASKQKVEIWNI